MFAQMDFASGVFNFMRQLIGKQCNQRDSLFSTNFGENPHLRSLWRSKSKCLLVVALKSKWNGPLWFRSFPMLPMNFFSSLRSWIFVFIDFFYIFVAILLHKFSSYFGWSGSASNESISADLWRHHWNSFFRPNMLIRIASRECVPKSCL